MNALRGGVLVQKVITLDFQPLFRLFSDMIERDVRSQQSQETDERRVDTAQVATDLGLNVLFARPCKQAQVRELLVLLGAVHALLATLDLHGPVPRARLRGK
jgi:hypothetical protein